MNVAKLIKDLGGVEAIRSGLLEMGIDISVKTIEKWRERQIVPMPRWIQLNELYRKSKNRDLKLSNYTKPEPAKCRQHKLK